MSNWIKVSGYTMISNGLPCHIGKYGKPFEKEIVSDELFKY